MNVKEKLAERIEILNSLADPDVKDPNYNPVREYMRQLSEDYWCAGWLHDLEFDLWSRVIGDNPKYCEQNRVFGPFPSELVVLAELALDNDKWCDYDHDYTLEEWEKEYELWLLTKQE